MKNPLIAFDMSSYLWRGLLAGKDLENGRAVIFNEKEVFINSADYGYDNSLSLMLKMMDDYKAVPVDCILVFEGLNSKSKRQLINKEYKNKDSRAPEAYEEFTKCKEMLRTLFLELGAQVMVQDYAEGDDTLAWLAENTERDLVIATYDNDLCAVNMDANQFGAQVETCISDMKSFNKYGIFDYHLVTTYKALVGDAGDGIKGCQGFGPAAFEKFCAQYGVDGLQELHDMLLSSDLLPIESMSAEPEHKLISKIFEQRSQVINSFDLAKLRPEWVNTMRSPIHHQAGMVRQLRATDDSRLRKWYGRTRLVTADIFDEACALALPLIASSREVALDIETSSADESDSWLAGQGKADGVDVFGSTLSGLSLTFGKNNQFSLYFSIDHEDTLNCKSEDLRKFIATINKPLVIQNVSFELAVLFNEWGAQQLDNGFHGFLPNVLDTKFEASYINENISAGLKGRSLLHLGYTQQSYDQTTKLTGVPSELPKGGMLLSQTEAKVKQSEHPTGRKTLETYTDDMGCEHAIEVDVMKLIDDMDPETGLPVIEVPAMETRRYKMNELSAEHVLGYGCDDTICTIALHNFYKLTMQLEHSYNVYLDVEIDAAYLHAKSFIDGVDISVEKLNELSAADDITYDTAWATVRAYLIDQGWEGTVPPVYTWTITPAQVKEAYLTVFGKPLDTMMRTLSKIVTFIRNLEDGTVFADLLERLIKGEPDEFNKYVLGFYKCEPQFNDGSTKQMQDLMYNVMGLPIRVRNKATDTMRAAGIREGSAKVDALAIAYALQECTPEQKEVLEALNLMGMVGTRRSLYYTKYPYFQHWKDGKVRSQHNQSSTNTRRASESSPNKQQLPKHAKIEGQAAKFREVIVPHRPDAVIVSMDFMAQELRVIADYSRDPNMVACFVGDNKKDMHALTGLGIAVRQQKDYGWSYEVFVEALEDKSHQEFKFVKNCRVLGKKTNFVSEYGSMAAKLAQTLMVSEEEAQAYLDAKESAFPVVSEWKSTVIAEAKKLGTVRTMLGAVRHLREALVEGDSWTKSKAERQAVNFKVQSSSAEMTKLAEGRMWKSNLGFRFDAKYLGPVHDECVWSVKISDLIEFIKAMHTCMVAQYADMFIPVMSSISFGKDFYNQIEIGDEPTPEAVIAGLAKL